MSEEKKIVIIGGGPAGVEVAMGLGNPNYKVTIIEKEDLPGGNLRQWHNLFPNFRSSSEVRKYLDNGLKKVKPSIITGSEAKNISWSGSSHKLTLSNGKTLESDAVIIATGFQPFDATRKEEYGYKIYDNVITSPDLEDIFRAEKPILTKQGKIPEKVAFIHCVGSRDKKSGNMYCSRVCCVTGVKQAIEIRQLLPDTKVYNFYMDLRMYSQNFEELYIAAQQKWGVNFIRGRVSEIAENIDGSLQLKAEDTLVGRPIRMNFDLVILLVGMVPRTTTELLGKSAEIDFTESGFLATADTHIRSNETKIPGIFVAGTCKEPLSIQETLTDARATSAKVISYLEKDLINCSNEELGL